MRPTATVVVTAWTADGYRREIVVADDEQTRMTDSRVRETFDGLSIDPKDFPEMVRFTVAVKPIPRR